MTDYGCILDGRWVWLGWLDWKDEAGLQVNAPVWNRHRDMALTLELLYGTDD